MTRSFVVKAVATAVMAAALPGAVQAQQTVNFEGAAFFRDPNPLVGVGDSLSIDFAQAGNVFGTPGGQVRAFGLNDLPGVVAGSTGQVSDLIARGSAPYFDNLPVSPFLTIGGYTFTLTQSSDGNAFGPINLSQSTIAGRPTVNASFNVAGTVTGGSFGSSTRIFFGTFSTQFPGSSIASLTQRIDNGTGAAANSFSATLNIAAIPEPSTYALMGAGVAMLGAFARRRNRA